MLILLLVLSLVLLVLTARHKFSRRWLKILLILLEILLALFLLYKSLFPHLSRPDPSGPLKVRTDRVWYTHETRYPEMATRGDEREIPVHVYCPEELGDRSHPLFLFSHGSFGVGSSNETLFYELASRGYIVMSLDHPKQAFVSTMSSGQKIYMDWSFFQEVMRAPGAVDLEGTYESLNRWVDPRIEDLNFVLDKILDGESDNPYEDKIDPGKIILSGHSLGGGAALAIGRERPEDVRALVILEAPFVKEITGIEGDHFAFRSDAYPRPILHVYSDALWGKLDTIATYALNERLIELDDPMYVNRHIEGVGHIGLTDMALLSPVLTQQIDGGLDARKAPETLLELNDVVLDFLEALDAQP